MSWMKVLTLRGVRVCSLVMAIAWASASASAQTTNARVAPHEMKRLEQVLRAVAQPSEGSTFRGVMNVASGAVFTASGVLIALHAGGTSEPLEIEPYLRGLGAATLIIVGSGMAISQFAAFGRESTDALRVARFRALAARGPMDPITFARFEGALLAEAQNARASRVASIPGNFAAAFGSAAVLALGIAAEDLDEDTRIALGVMGGFGLAGGVIDGISALSTESEYERIVRAYVEDRTQVRKARARRVALLPSVSRNGAGLVLRGEL